MYYIYDTSIGKITITVTDDGAAITGVHLGVHTEVGECGHTTLTDRAATQINEYLAGERHAFDLPLNAVGTPFQKLVWEALQTIPYGETRSYKEIARLIGKPGASRAVGMANHRNPIAIIIPCHRVIGANGSLVGYAAGLSIKEILLTLERRCQISNDYVNKVCLAGLDGNPCSFLYTLFGLLLILQRKISQLDSSF